MMILMVGLLAAWGASAYYRCSDAKVRRYLVYSAALMIGWMILVLVKYASDNAFISEYAWYLYYLPMTVLPLLAFFGVLRSATLDRIRKVRQLEAVAGLISAASILLVLTNGLHRTVFQFDPSSPTFSSDYTYGPLYWAVIGWILFLYLVTGVILGAVARRQLQGAIFILLGLAFLGLVFNVMYVQRVQAVFTQNMSLVYVILFVVATETSLRLGLLPSLSWSSATFEALPLELRVVSQRNEDVIRTGGRKSLSPVEVETILRTGTGSDPNVSYQTFPVLGGTGLFGTNIAPMREQTRALKEKQDILRSRNAILERDHEVQSRLASLRYERQFLDEVEAGLAHTAQRIQELLAQLSAPDTHERVERAQILEKIRLLVSYSKARGRLVLAEYEGGLLDSQQLELLMAQSAADLRAAGIECALMNELRRGLPARAASLLYDCLFDFALASMDCVNPVLLIHLSDKGEIGGLQLRVAHGCDSDIPLPYEVPDSTKASIAEQGGTHVVEGSAGSFRMIVSIPQMGGHDGVS